MPAALSAPISSRAPGLSCSRSRYTVSSASALRPSSRATRRLSDSRKSISPRMAASVISATWAFLPHWSAISSMHSMSISVESMSVTNRPKSFRRRPAGTKAKSTPAASHSAAMPSRVCASTSRNALASICSMARAPQWRARFFSTGVSMSVPSTTRFIKARSGSARWCAGCRGRGAACRPWSPSSRRRRSPSSRT